MVKCLTQTQTVHNVPSHDSHPGVELPHYEATTPPNYITVDNLKADFVAIMTCLADVGHPELIKNNDQVIQINLSN